MTDATLPHDTGPLGLCEVSMDDPWKWLAAGWSDMKRAPLWSLSYGLAFVLVGIAGSVLLWSVNLESLIPVLAGGFALIGPMLAVGLYEISRRLEAGEPLTLRGVVFVRTAEPLQLAYMGFVLLFMYLVWARVAMLLYAGFVHFDNTPLDQFSVFMFATPTGQALLAVGTVTGALFGLVVFAVTALSVPMLVDRHVDVVTAAVTSVRTVLHSPKAMLLWAWIIAILVGFGFATLFVGLIVVFPLVGHATWHAYRDTIDASAWPPTHGG